MTSFTEWQSGWEGAQAGEGAGPQPMPQPKVRMLQLHKMTHCLSYEDSREGEISLSLSIRCNDASSDRVRQL